MSKKKRLSNSARDKVIPIVEVSKDGNEVHITGYRRKPNSRKAHHRFMLQVPKVIMRKNAEGVMEKVVGKKPADITPKDLSDVVMKDAVDKAYAELPKETVPIVAAATALLLFFCPAAFAGDKLWVREPTGKVTATVEVPTKVNESGAVRSVTGAITGTVTRSPSGSYTLRDKTGRIIGTAARK